MRSELVSAELSAIPCVISKDSRLVQVLCGSYVLSYNLKTGRIIESTEAIIDQATDLVSNGSNVFVANKSGSKSISFNRANLEAVSAIDGLRVAAAEGHLTVVVKNSTNPDEMVLGYIEGPDIAESRMVPLFTGVFSSVSCSKWVIAFVSGRNRRTLVVFDASTKTRREYTHTKAFTCTAVHPSEVQAAAGDIEGVITRWSGESTEYSSRHHWHSIPVASIAFSSSGTMLLSGAEEGVLCLWTDVSSSTKPQFVPRLGGPITHITISRCNQFAAVSIKSNKIVVVDLFTRSIQSVIQGALTELDGGAAVVNALGSVAPHLVSVSTKSQVQLFDMDARRALTKTPIAVQERNNIPSNLRAKIIAQPWECMQVRVVPSTDPSAPWYMMTALERKMRSGKKALMIKIFLSSNQGGLWNLHTLVMGAHEDSVVGIEWSPVISEFLTASKDGKVKVWRQDKDIWSVVRTLEFKQRTPGFISSSSHGIIVVGFGEFVTLYDPKTFRELTNGSVKLDSPAVFAGLVEDDHDEARICMFSLSQSGEATLWDLKKLAPIRAVNLGQNISTSATVYGNRLLVPGQDGSVISVTESTKQLLVDRIMVAKESVESVVPVAKGIVVVSDNGKSIYRLLFEGEGGEARAPLVDSEMTQIVEEEETSEETPTSHTDAERVKKSDSQKLPKIRGPTTKGLITKLFPLENSLDSVGTPEDQFVKLIGSLMV